MTQNLLHSQANGPGHSRPACPGTVQIIEGEVLNARSLQRQEKAKERFLELAGTDDAEVLVRPEHIWIKRRI